MNDAFEDCCGEDHGGDSCPICRGEELDPDFIERMKAAAAQPGRVMSAEEFGEWLRSL